MAVITASSTSQKTSATPSVEASYKARWQQTSRMGSPGGIGTQISMDGVASWWKPSSQQSYARLFGRLAPQHHGGQGV